MTFSALGAVLAASLTRDMADRERAQQLTLVGGLLGRSPLGIAAVAALVTQGGDGAGGPAPGPGAPVPLPVRVAIPLVAGLQVEEARTRLSALGLVPATAGASSPDPVGVVVGSEPPETTVVGRGSTVTLLVSVGSLVPDVVGSRVDDAVATVKAAGFDPQVVGVDRPDGKPEVVLSQDPDGGTYLSDGATVVLTAIKHDREDAAGEIHGAPVKAVHERQSSPTPSATD